jgi:hypothetical protein
MPEIFPLLAYQLDKIEKFLTSLRYDGFSLVVESRTLNISDQDRNAYKFYFAVLHEDFGRIGKLEITWYRKPLNVFKLDLLQIDKRFRNDKNKKKKEQFNFGSKILKIFQDKILNRFNAIGILYDNIKDMNEWYVGNRTEKANHENLLTFYEDKGWSKLRPEEPKSKIRYFSKNKLSKTQLDNLKELSLKGVF